MVALAQERVPQMTDSQVVEVAQQLHQTSELL